MDELQGPKCGHCNRLNHKTEECRFKKLKIEHQVIKQESKSKEFNEARKKGVCFKCNKSWDPKHKCAKGPGAVTFNQLIIDESDHLEDLIVSSLNINSSPDKFKFISVPILLKDVQVLGGLDTYASHSFISPSLARQLRVSIFPISGTTHLGDSNSKIQRTGRCELPVSVIKNGEVVSFNHSFDILNLESSHCLLGIDIIPKLGISICDIPKQFPKVGDEPAERVVHLMDADESQKLDEPTIRMIDVDGSPIRDIDNTVCFHVSLPLEGSAERVIHLKDADESQKKLDEPTIRMIDVDGSSQLINPIGKTLPWEVLGSLELNIPDEIYYLNLFKKQLKEVVLKPLLDQNAAIAGLCTASNAELEINTLNDEVVHIKQYRINYNLRPVVNEQINKWLNDGIIRKLDEHTHWNTPIVVVPKRDVDSSIKGWRVCLDLRHLNAVMKSVNYPLPLIKDILESVDGSVVFSRLDLKSSFNQIKLRVCDQIKTAFTWNGVQYCFVGVPFGIKPISAVFQKVMLTLLGHLSFVKVFVDDIIIHQSHTSFTSLI